MAVYLSPGPSLPAAPQRILSGCTLLQWGPEDHSDSVTSECDCLWTTSAFLDRNLIGYDAAFGGQDLASWADRSYEFLKRVRSTLKLWGHCWLSSCLKAQPVPHFALSPSNNSLFCFKITSPFSATGLESSLSPPKDPDLINQTPTSPWPE